MFKNFTSLKLSRQKCDDPEKLKKCEKREKERMFRVYLFQILACVGFLRLPLLGDLGRRDGDRRLPQGLQIDLKKRQKRSVKTEIRLPYVFLFYIQWQIKSIARNEIIKSEDYCIRTFGRGKLATTLTASSHRCPTNAHSMHEFEIFLYSRDDETSFVNRFSLFFEIFFAAILPPFETYSFPAQFSLHSPSNRIING